MLQRDFQRFLHCPLGSDVPKLSVNARETCLFHCILTTRFLTSYQQGQPGDHDFNVLHETTRQRTGHKLNWEFIPTSPPCSLCGPEEPAEHL